LNKSGRRVVQQRRLFFSFCIFAPHLFRTPGPGPEATTDHHQKPGAPGSPGETTIIGHAATRNPQRGEKTAQATASEQSCDTRH
jgi:hypothetical protein